MVFMRCKAERGREGFGYSVGDGLLVDLQIVLSRGGGGKEVGEGLSGETVKMHIKACDNYENG
jgi:hypothetical protein